ncbi:MAG: 4Fe-4S binding protein [Bacillota bacterium]
MLTLWRFWRPAPKRAEPVGDEVLPCSQCLLCVSACPAGALQYHQRKWQVDLSRCIFCRSCAEVCPNLLIGSQ